MQEEKKQEIGSKQQEKPACPMAAPVLKILSLKS